MSFRLSRTQSKQLQRSRLELMLSVLSVVNNGVDKPARIVSAANLSWGFAHNIIVSMVEQGLLNEVKITGSKGSRSRYEITDKGKNVLEYLDGARY